MKNSYPPPAHLAAHARRGWLSLLLLMCALSFSAQAQKTTKGAAAGPAPGGGCTPSVTANTLNICQGGSAVLTVNTPCALNPYTFSWSPNRNISSTTDGQVVVNPLTTTTYTVTASTSGSSPRVMTVTVNVQTNCCQTATVPAGKTVELNNYYTYDYNLSQYGFGDPFQYDFSTSPPTPRAPGTVFHVAGGTLTLHGNAYRLPTGGVLLMEAGADVLLDDSQLYLNGGTITAACNDMWGGLVHSGHGHGLFSKAVGTLPPRIMHSKRGIEFTRDPMATPSTNNLFLSDLEFLHNYQSLVLDYSGSPAPTREYVRFCTFDADPQLMKSPYKATSSTDYWHAPTHVRVLGDARNLRFRRNTLQRALVGLTLVEPGTKLQADTCAWVDFQLAGIANQGKPDPKYYPSQLGVTGGKFVFPTAATHPATSQASQTLADYGASLITDATLGISVQAMPVSVSGVNFSQNNTTPYTTFGYGNYRTQQIGILSQNLVVAQNNTFRALGTGIVLEVPADPANISRNLFSECDKGLSLVRGYGQALVDCNTFERGISLSTRPGLSYGIVNEAASHIRLEDPAVQPGGTLTILKNRFDDGGAGNNGFYALYNNSPTGPLAYYSYDDYSQYLANALLVNSSVSLTGINVAPNYVKGTACVNLTPNGLQRNGAPSTDTQSTMSAELAQSAPNPAHGPTTIAYHLPKGTQTATLLVRRALDARPVDTLPLNTSAQALRLDAARYPAGVYFYTLLVDGNPVATRRLVVE